MDGYNRSIEGQLMRQQISHVYHDLGILLDAGVPILRSLKTIMPPLKGKLKRAFEGLLKNVSEGNTLSEAMELYPKVFIPLDVSIIKAADTSGSLPQSFKMLSEWYEFRTKLKRMTKSGFVLPFAVLHIAAFVPPMIFYIGGLCSFSDAMWSVILTLSIFYIPSIIIYSIFKLTPYEGFLRRLLDKILHGLPVIGRALMYLALSRYCRSFYMLYSAGVPITKCAEIATATTNNTAVADYLKGGIESCHRGRPISEGFSKRLPNEFLELWFVGEETGDLDKVTKKMADYSSDKAEFALTEIIKWIPRIVYALVCVMIIVKIFNILSMIVGAYSGAI